MQDLSPFSGVMPPMRRTVRLAFQNEMERTKDKLGRALTPCEQRLINRFYQAGIEDKADEMQGVIQHYESLLNPIDQKRYEN